ncbi:MAG: hypothetical protein ACOCWO_03955, partial [Candidatus Muiribacteriaceae bacterium]
MKTGLRVFLTLVIVAVSFNIYATPYFNERPLKTIDGDIAYPFEKIELLMDASPKFTQERFHEQNVITHPALLELTEGNQTPSSAY